VDAPSDPAWLCKSTGEAQVSWAPFGPDGKFDSLSWGSPPTIVSMLHEEAPAELILPATTRHVPTNNRQDEFSVAPARPAAPAHDAEEAVTTEAETDDKPETAPKDDDRKGDAKAIDAA
jgi:hypothetical protein